MHTLYAVFLSENSSEFARHKLTFAFWRLDVLVHKSKDAWITPKFWWGGPIAHALLAQGSSWISSLIDYSQQAWACIFTTSAWKLGELLPIGIDNTVQYLHGRAGDS